MSGGWLATPMRGDAMRALAVWVSGGFAANYAWEMLQMPLFSDRSLHMRRTLTPFVLTVAFAAPVLGGVESLTPAATPTPQAVPSVGPAFDSLMPAYDAARAALSADRLSDLAQPSRDLRRLLAALGDGLTAESTGVPPAKLRELRALLPALRKAADALVAASTLPAAREAFGELSKSLVAWRQLAGRGPDVAYCPMVTHEWLQPPGTDIDNPYLGKAMAGCGSRRTER